MKKGLAIGAGILILAAIVFANLRAGDRHQGVKVYSAEVKRHDISQVIKASGAIDPKEKVNISAHVVGKIEKLYVQEGERIEAGQPFLRLEQQAYIAQRDQWAAQLRSSETGVAKAKAQLADARIKLTRAQNLHRQGILAREQLEAAQLQETSARLAVDEAEEAVRQARANLVKAADDLTKTTIYAPLSGRVVKLNAEQGEVVVSGTMNNPGSVIGTIADLSEILAKVDVDETEVVGIKLGQTAVVKVDAIPGRQYHGKVIEVGSSGFSKASQPDVTFFEVKILLSDADDRLRPGMSVRSEILALSKTAALVLPIQAVVERPPLKEQENPGKAKPAADASRSGEPGGGDDSGEIKVVFVIGGSGGDGGKARQRPVETGISDETRVEITAGLKAGERVVIGPYRTLRDLKDGDPVFVSKTSEAEDRKASDKEKG
ncbi:MAG TPA: efflux RND transporter periplasmic adaptor subunit [Thermoanaerobaculia bacterium]|nr:efflux RND transporter periplasmic adaptor subunit [Thermoanaerobaculia bacterium]